MPRVAASNGVRPEIRALGVIHLNKPVTPTEINKHVGTGDYAAKYISFLRTRFGFEFTAQKDGRKIVSYTLIKEPSNAEALRNTQPPVKKAKNEKLNVPVARKSEEKTFNKNDVASSYSIDKDFDNIDLSDFKDVA